MVISADVPSSPAVLENNSAGLAAVPSTGGNTGMSLHGFDLARAYEWMRLEEALVFVRDWSSKF